MTNLSDSPPHFLRPRAALQAAAAPLAWSAFIALPAAGWGWLDGVPLGRVEASALALVWWTWATTRHLPAGRTLALLAVAKILLAGAFVERGFVARYYANESWTPPVEASIEYGRRAFTRRDVRLVFGTSGAPDLPLHFFNDVRFNFFLSEQPNRAQLAYSAEWDGVLRVEGNASPSNFYLDVAPGISGELVIDGNRVVSVDSVSPASTSVRLERGWHPIRIRISARYGAGRWIAAGEIVEGSRRPFDGRRVLPAPAPPLRLTIDAALKSIGRVLDLFVLGMLAVVAAARARDAWKTRRVMHLLWLVGIAEALLFAGPYAARMVVLTGGDDWLAYESYARDIALGDVLQRELGGPYFFQVLYPHVIALTHLGFGDGLFGIILVQRLLLPAAAGWVAAMTSRLFGPRAGWIALLGGGAFLYAKIGPWTDALLTELVFLPLVAGWIAMLVAMAQEGGTAPRAAAAGALGGVATLIRSTLLLAWPPVLLLWWASLRARRGRLLVSLLVTMIAVFSLVGIRNWLVADRFVLTSTNFGISFFLGNEPTRELEPAPPGRSRVYDLLGLEGPVRTVAEFAAQAPGEFIGGLVNKAAYTVGFFRWSRLPGGETMRTSWLYVGIWVLALAGIIRILRESLSQALVWLPAAGALSHFAVMVLVMPFGYADRYILPLYPLLIPYAAFAAEPLPSAVRRLAIWWRALVLPAAAWMGRLASAVFDPVLRRPRLWLYLGYIAAVTLYLDWQPEESDALALATALLLPVAAFGVAQLTRSERIFCMVGGAVWAAAFIAVARGGSRAVGAINDPLFWGLVAAVAVGTSAATGRWRIVSATLATIGGALTMVAIVLPVFPDFESTFPGIDYTAINQSLSAMSGQLGPVATVCLFGLWVQGIVAVRPREGWSWQRRIVAGARGALLAGLILTFAGALPGTGIDVRLWFVTLGVLLGLVEAVRA